MLPEAVAPPVSPSLAELRPAAVAPTLDTELGEGGPAPRGLSLWPSSWAQSGGGKKQSGKAVVHNLSLSFACSRCGVVGKVMHDFI